MAWQRTVGESSSSIPAIACLLVTACTVLTYSLILADTLPALLAAATGIVVPRSTALSVVTTVGVLLPLCLLKELRKLAPFSLLGILGTVLYCYLHGLPTTFEGLPCAESLAARYCLG